ATSPAHASKRCCQPSKTLNWRDDSRHARQRWSLYCANSPRNSEGRWRDGRLRPSPPDLPAPNDLSEFVILSDAKDLLFAGCPILTSCLSTLGWDSTATSRVGLCHAPSAPPPPLPTSPPPPPTPTPPPPPTTKKQHNNTNTTKKN